MTFLHFKNGNKTTLSAIVEGYELLGDEYDGLQLKLTILNNKIELELNNSNDYLIINGGYLNQDDLEKLKTFIKNQKINWDNGYEFIDYFDLDGSQLELVASRQSTTFDLITSSQNIKNITKINKILK